MPSEGKDCKYLQMRKMKFSKDKGAKPGFFWPTY